MLVERLDRSATCDKFQEILMIVCLIITLPFYILITLILLLFVSGLTTVIAAAIFLAACGYWVRDKLVARFGTVSTVSVTQHDRDTERVGHPTTHGR